MFQFFIGPNGWKFDLGLHGGVFYPHLHLLSAFPRIRSTFRVFYRVLRHRKGRRGEQHPHWHLWDTLVSILSPVITYPCRSLLHPSSFTISHLFCVSHSWVMSIPPGYRGSFHWLFHWMMENLAQLFGACLCNTASASSHESERCWKLAPSPRAEDSDPLVLGPSNFTPGFYGTLSSRYLAKEKQITGPLLRNQQCVSSLHLPFEFLLPHPRSSLSTLGQEVLLLYNYALFQIFCLVLASRFMKHQSQEYTFSTLSFLLSFDTVYKKFSTFLG